MFYHVPVMRLYSLQQMRGRDQGRGLFELQETLREVHVQEEIVAKFGPVTIVSGR